MKAYRWLLMDADNTLFDFDAAEDLALTRTLLHFGLPADAEIKACYLTINSALWDAFDRGDITQSALSLERFVRFLEARGIPGDAAEWDRFYINTLAGCPNLLPGAEELCRRLSRKYTLALTTNGLPLVQRGRLEGSPLAPFFGGRVFISGELDCRKPERAFFDKVLEVLGAAHDRDKVLVVGDSLSSDIQGACNAQLDCVWLHRAGTSPDPLCPTFQVESLAQLGQLLGV